VLCAQGRESVAYSRLSQERCCTLSELGYPSAGRRVGREDQQAILGRGHEQAPLVTCTGEQAAERRIAGRPGTRVEHVERQVLLASRAPHHVTWIAAFGLQPRCQQ